MADLFGVPLFLASETFNKLVETLVAHVYDQFVKMSHNDQDWESELRRIIANYVFLCIRAWDGFHVYLNLKLKSYFSFKKRYTMSSLALVGYNKRFLYAAFGAPGSTHDAQMLKSTNLLKNISHNQVIPDGTIYLGETGEVSLVTVGDSAFLQFPWFIKCYNTNAQDLQQRFFNKKLC